ncbi:hypothetical protein Desgi_0699 [Desulfoscipio gibsoniae DSM 7213]|uniref:Uncharacterized protein n=1 Tax=Desulfoscipio gibsoniae DSM 7213 TaxID=767817 RepID=R4KCF5_9FIRM|nr:hypothetical protein Desgi_0699 [Desulfoscipio gibsoniae DSM 7213]
MNSFIRITNHIFTATIVFFVLVIIALIVDILKISK